MAEHNGDSGNPPSLDEIREALRVLRHVAKDRSLLATMDLLEREELFQVAGRVNQPAAKETKILQRAIRKKERKEQRDHDRSVIQSTGVRTQRKLWESTAGSSPPQLPAAASTANDDEGPELEQPRGCYVCKQDYTRLHHFYDAMCRTCGELSFQKRNQTADLTGRVALMTGARLKIGYQAALMMLRAGCRVVVTTRFPVDSAQRYAKEKDYSEWKDRLQIFGLDLRHTPSVELFCSYFERVTDRLDFIINNAAQTVRRPPAFYAHMMEQEAAPLASQSKEVKHLLTLHMEATGALRKGAGLLSPGDGSLEGVSTVLAALQKDAPGMGMWASAAMSQMPYSKDDALLGAEVFPTGKFDLDRQQVDLRDVNSWRLKLADVPTPELLEVQLVNVIAPFVLNGKLKPLMARHRTGDKHVVNVSAMEGQFNRGTKTDRHPHTNMAKAALNMMTRTSAQDYVKAGIHMNSVDTGWVTDEDPVQYTAQKVEEMMFEPPLDIIDGAARILDPIFHGLNTGQHVWGQFLKDYRSVEW